jgi:hypothetical protein
MTAITESSRSASAASRTGSQRPQARSGLTRRSSATDGDAHKSCPGASQSHQRPPSAEDAGPRSQDSRLRSRDSSPRPRCASPRSWGSSPHPQDPSPQPRDSRPRSQDANPRSAERGLAEADNFPRSWGSRLPSQESGPAARNPARFPGFQPPIPGIRAKKLSDAIATKGLGRLTFGPHHLLRPLDALLPMGEPHPGFGLQTPWTDP